MYTEGTMEVDWRCDCGSASGEPVPVPGPMFEPVPVPAPVVVEGV